MKTKRKLSPEEIFEVLEQQANEAEARRILALSDEELDGELRELGFDPAAERAWGRALGERVVRKAREAEAEAAAEAAKAREPADEEPPEGQGWASAPPPPATLRPTPRWVMAAAAVLAAAAVGGGGYAVARMLQQKDEPRPPVVPEVPDAAPTEAGAPPRFIDTEKKP